jgi:hypothetical protein
LDCRRDLPRLPINERVWATLRPQPCKHAKIEMLRTVHFSHL